MFGSSCTSRFTVFEQATKMLAAVTAVLILSPLLVVGNFIEDVDFPYLCNNQTFGLKDSCIGIISANLITSHSLRCLSIVNSDIRYVEAGAFDRVPNLFYLNLDGNLIPPDKLFNFGNVSSLTQLSLNDQKTNIYYGEVLEVNSVYPNLQDLYLRDAKISGISKNVINPFPQLVFLDLSMNKLVSFDSKQLGETSLQYLNLNHNQISQISFDKLNDLVSLNLGGNRITALESFDLRGLSSLQYLSIAYNQINSITGSAFRYMVKLEHLNMSDNALSTFAPELFTPLTSLYVLILDNNQFTNVPLISSNISVLSMNRNNIRSLMSNSLDPLPNLRELSLTGNKISDIHPETFQSQELLTKLYLNDNELTQLPRNWSQSLKGLRYLNLSGNKFTTIESVFDLTNVALKQVHLANNPIIFIETGMLKSIPQNVTIYLNPIDEFL